jgi:hypothetical protein
VYSLLNARFLLLAEALFNFNAHCRTMFSLSDEECVHVIGQHCPVHPLKVKDMHCTIKYFKVLYDTFYCIFFNEFLHIKWRFVLNCAIYHIYENQTVEVLLKY